MSNRPHNKDGYEFHIREKNIAREALSKERLTLTDLAALSVDAKFWKIEKGDPDKVNVQFLSTMIEEFEKYRKTIKHYEKKLSMKERLALNQSARFLFALYKQDSAYFERIGGHITLFITNYDAWKNHPNKVEVLRGYYNWWSTNDIRGYSKKWINTAWVTFIELYETKEFVRLSTNWIMDYLHKHSKEWKVDSNFHPDTWYPKGKGQITYLVSGRTD